MSFKKAVCLLLTGIFILQAVVFTVLADNDRIGYIFTYTWSDADTTASGSTTVLRHLWNMGYDAGTYLNNGAASVYSVLPIGQIVVITTHGGPGYVQLGTEANTSYLYARTSVTGNNRSLSNLTAGSLSGTKLVMYVACKSGCTNGGGNNLVDMTYDKGARCSVGWTEEIRADIACEWVRLFFEKADQEEDVIWECFNHADYWTEYIYGDNVAYTLQCRLECGNISQYLYQ